MVQRMVGPEAVSANALAHEVGVSQNALSRWLREARSLQGMGEKPGGSKRSKKKWSGAEKLRIVMEASALTGSELGALLRREGVHEAELAEWRAAAEAALGEQPRSRAKPSGEVRRIKELERELHRKERALAEAAALLVLKKKVQEIWGGEDDTTDSRSGR
jgi:transposase-like protein